MVWIELRFNKKKRMLLSLRERLNMLGTMLISDEVMKDHKMSTAIRSMIKRTKSKIKKLKADMIVFESDIEEERKKRIGITKKYYCNNKEKIIERNRTWQKINREKLRVKYKAYREKNKDKLAVRKKKWYKKNRDRLIKKAKEHYIKNQGKINAEATFKRRIKKQWGLFGKPEPFLVREVIASDDCTFDTTTVIKKFKSQNKTITIYQLKKGWSFKVQIIDCGKEAWWRFDHPKEVDSFIKNIKRKSLKEILQ